MIENLTIKNFKSLTDFEIPCAPLNIFTGTNGAGKSSALQSLLLLRQSYTTGFFLRNGSPLFLGNNESLVSLGTFKDVLSADAPKLNEIIYFKLVSKDYQISFQSVPYDSDRKDLNFINGTIEPSWFELGQYPLFNGNFEYLAAERISPKEDYPRFPSDENSLGKDGSYTAHYLEKYGNFDIPISNLRINPNSKSLSLIDQVNSWMGLISNNIEVLTKENLSTNRIELSFRYNRPDGVPSQDYKPSNVGFGITHTLPIVVAILAAEPGDIILIENPETHLHPKGQSNLAKLFALAAENGVQIFMETHSDHILNGTRISIKQGIIAESDVNINFLSKNENNVSLLNLIKIDDDGGYSDWPEGFFDEWDNSLNDLL